MPIYEPSLAGPTGPSGTGPTGPSGATVTGATVTGPTGATVTGPTGNTGPTGPYVMVANLASNDASSGANTTMRKITGLDLTTGTGTFQFKYIIRYQGTASTTGSKFAVNHSGTVTAFVANHHWAQSLSTAASLTADQDIATTVGLYSVHAVRAKNITAGPNTALDGAGADMLWIVEGMFVCSVDGNLELYHGSEVAAVATVMAGSSLVLTKVA